VVASPTVRLPAFFIPAEYVVPFRTIGFDDSLIGEIGFMNFTHAIEFDFAGFSKESIAELLKDVNAGAVYIVELIDGQLAVLGTANRGLVLGAAGRSGKLGSDKRGKTLKAENNGYRWPVMPLSAAAKDAFFRRFLGYNEVRSVVGVQPATLTVNISFTIIVADFKAFQIGDRVNVRGYFGSEWSSATFGPFPGTITNIVANGANFNVVILGDAANGGTVYTNSRWKILRITENGNL